jgi:hypothetical protein
MIHETGRLAVAGTSSLNIRLNQKLGEIDGVKELLINPQAVMRELPSARRRLSPQSRASSSSQLRIFLLGQNLRAINASRLAKGIEKNRYGKSSMTRMQKRSSF